MFLIEVWIYIVGLLLKIAFSFLTTRCINYLANTDSFESLQDSKTGFHSKCKRGSLRSEQLLIWMAHHL